MRFYYLRMQPVFGKSGTYYLTKRIARPFRNILRYAIIVGYFALREGGQPNVETNID